MDPVAKTEPSLAELFGHLTRETGVLVRQEVQLATVEMGQKASVAGRDLRIMAAGWALAHAGLLVVMAALVILVSAYLPLWASALLIGGAALLAGWVLLMSGLASLRRLSPVPKEVLETLREDRAMLKEQLR